MRGHPLVLKGDKQENGSTVHCQVTHSASFPPCAYVCVSRSRRKQMPETMPWMLPSYWLRRHRGRPFASKTIARGLWCWTFGGDCNATGRVLFLHRIRFPGALLYRELVATPVPEPTALLCESARKRGLMSPSELGWARMLRSDGSPPSNVLIGFVLWPGVIFRHELAPRAAMHAWRMPHPSRSGL